MAPASSMAALPSKRTTNRSWNTYGGIGSQRGGGAGEAGGERDDAAAEMRFFLGSREAARGERDGAGPPKQKRHRPKVL